MWGFLSPIRQAVGGNGTQGNRGPPVTPASCAKAKENHLLGATQGADRDMLVKVTFHAIHDSAPENAAMYLTGSLPSLGSWDVKRARKMNRAPNGSWALAIYIPEKAEFLYQYLLIQEPEDGSAVQEPIVLWEGGLERKCKLVERCCRPSKPPSHAAAAPCVRARDLQLYAACTPALSVLLVPPNPPPGASGSPNRSMVLADDTRGEGTARTSPTPANSSPAAEQVSALPQLTVRPLRAPGVLVHARTPARRIRPCVSPCRRLNGGGGAVAGMDTRDG